MAAMPYNWQLCLRGAVQDHYGPLVFFILIPISIKVLLILHTKFQPNIPSHIGKMDLCVGRRKFSNGHCDLIPLQIFIILISINSKILLRLHTKFQPNIPSHSGENGDFNSFAIFSNGGHLECLII